MNLVIIGSDIPEFPGFPEISRVFIFVDSTNINKIKQLVEKCREYDLRVVLVLSESITLNEDVLDEASEVVILEETVSINSRFSTLAADYGFAYDDTIVCLAWDDSDEHYDLLNTLQRNDFSVLDMRDGFAELVIEEPVDYSAMVSEITEKVTSEVLKIVRAEIMELMSARHWRKSGKKA